MMCAEMWSRDSFCTIEIPRLTTEKHAPENICDEHDLLLDKNHL